MRHVTAGVGTGISGIGLGLGLYVLQVAGLNMPTWLLVALGAAAVLLAVIGIAMEVRAHRRRPDLQGLRTGVITRRGGVSNLAGSTFYDTLDVAIDSEGETDAPGARFGVHRDDDASQPPETRPPS